MPTRLDKKIEDCSSKNRLKLMSNLPENKIDGMMRYGYLWFIVFFVDKAFPGSQKGVPRAFEGVSRPIQGCPKAPKIDQVAGAKLALLV